MEKIFITSDNHFYHKSILNFCPTSRMGITDVEEMNAKMVKVWNSQVTNNDTVYCLGDLSFGNYEKTIEILEQLNGKIHLILGNHDHKWTGNKEVRSYLHSIQHYKMLRYMKMHFALFHFPILEWDRMHYGSYHLFGHVHGNVPARGRSMDVGIDTRTDMRLYEIDEIIELLKDAPILARTR